MTEREARLYLENLCGEIAKIVITKGNDIEITKSADGIVIKEEIKKRVR